MKVLRKLEKSEYNAGKCVYTSHFKDRLNRINRIGRKLGTIDCGFLIDKGHVNGLEEHFVTTTGMILIRNYRTKKLITVLIARPAQIKRYYNALNMNVSSCILDKAYENQMNGLNV